MAAIKDGHPNGEDQERKADADESYRSNSQRQFTWPPSPGTCMSAMCRRSEHHNSGSGCRCGILSPRRTALHCSRICCGQFFAEGIIDAQLSVIPKRFLDDKKGQRTGYATRYSENTIMWCHWFGTTVQLRPELRYDRAWDRKAYDNGRRQNQLTAASDLIFHF
jgi:hypothetical protein